jgi:NodT family efflux transporter outer membrane factor (OMF) lipoprotein
MSTAMRFLVPAATLALCFAMAGCASSGGLHPTGKLTDPRSLKAERSLAQVTLSPTAWPAQDWWTGFGDAQLTALIGEALQTNPSLDAAEGRARQAQAMADSMNAARKPQVDLDAGANGERLSSKDPIYPPFTLGTFAWGKSVTLDFSWDLDLWGGKRDAWEAALGRSRAAQIDAYAARIELSVNVARAYVRLGYAFAQQDVAEAERQRADTSLELTRRLVAGGMGTPQQEYLADSQATSAEQQKVQADRAIDAARSSLSVLLGQGPDRGLAITRPHMLDLGMAALPDKLPADLIGRRADLVAARWQVEAAARDIKAAKTEFLPNISIGAMAGVLALGDSTNLFQLPARTYGVAPALSLPIFDGGRLRANLAAADAGYDQLVARYNTLLISALNEVSDQLSALASTRTQISLEKRAQQDARKSWEDAMKAYKGGVSGPLTPLISRQQLLLTEQRLAALESQQADASIRLIEALGGGYGATASMDSEPTADPGPSSPAKDGLTH